MNSKYSHKNGSHRDGLSGFTRNIGTNYKEIYEFDNLTNSNKNYLSILEEYIRNKYEGTVYKILNKASVHIDITRSKLNNEYSIIIGDKSFDFIKDNDIQA